MANPASMLNVLNGTETSQPLQLGAGTTLNGRPMPGGGANALTTTASALALTSALHAGKIINVQAAAPFVYTLPAATGTGDTYEFVIETPATAATSKIETATITAELLSGMASVLTTTSANMIGYSTTAGSSTVWLNGTTLGGVAGDRITFKDIGASSWSVQMFSRATGTTATPFAST